MILISLPTNEEKNFLNEYTNIKDYQSSQWNHLKIRNVTPAGWTIGKNINVMSIVDRLL